MKKLNYKNVLNHKSLTENKGITLIALIVTIIIVLILASVSVAIFSNNNIIKKSKFAGETYQNKINEEEKAMQNYASTMNEYSIADAGRDNVTISKEEYEQLKNVNKYSTEEQEIGSWIDGKTLYQKTFKYTGQYYSNQTLNTGLTNIDTMFVKDGYYKYGIYIYPLSYNHPDTHNTIAYFIEKPNICLRFGSYYSSSYYIQEIIFTLIYTKL